MATDLWIYRTLKKGIGYVLLIYSLLLETTNSLALTPQFLKMSFSIIFLKTGYKIMHWNFTFCILNISFSCLLTCFQQMTTLFSSFLIRQSLFFSLVIFLYLCLVFSSFVYTFYCCFIIFPYLSYWFSLRFLVLCLVSVH